MAKAPTAKTEEQTAQQDAPQPWDSAVGQPASDTQDAQADDNAASAPEGETPSEERDQETPASADPLATLAKAVDLTPPGPDTISSEAKDAATPVVNDAIAEEDDEDADFDSTLADFSDEERAALDKEMRRYGIQAVKRIRAHRISTEMTARLIDGTQHYGVAAERREEVAE